MYAMRASFRTRTYASDSCASSACPKMREGGRRRKREEEEEEQEEEEGGEGGKNT